MVDGDGDDSNAQGRPDHRHDPEPVQVEQQRPTVLHARGLSEPSWAGLFTTSFFVFVYTMLSWTFLRNWRERRR
jgi:hypothetical protein